MLRVETVFTRYFCPKFNQEVDVRVDRLRDADSKRILSQKFECDKAADCCLNAMATAEQSAACPHPEAKRQIAQQEHGAG
jgi:hypothetical protein